MKLPLLLLIFLGASTGISITDPDLFRFSMPVAVSLHAAAIACVVVATKLAWGADDHRFLGIPATLWPVASLIAYLLGFVPMYMA